MLKLSETGRRSDEIIAELEAKRAEDVRWADGRTFGMITMAAPRCMKSPSGPPCLPA